MTVELRLTLKPRSAVPLLHAHPRPPRHPLPRPAQTLALALAQLLETARAQMDAAAAPAASLLGRIDGRRRQLTLRSSRGVIVECFEGAQWNQSELFGPPLLCQYYS